MTDQWTNRLSEYLDDELLPVERQQLEAHLRDCAACSMVLEEIRAVVSRAGQLEDRDPRADLWPGIRAEIDGRKVIDLATQRTPARRFSFSLSQLVAAAAALVLVSGGTAWLISTDRPGATTAVQDTPAVAPAFQSVRFDPRGRADSAITELERILADESGSLDSSTVRILTHNLAVIDRAIAQAKSALDADPGNAYLNDHLARTMRKKIEVLRRAADLALVAS